MLQPTEDRIIVEEVEQEEKLECGLILASQSLEKTVKHGIVVATGPGRLIDNANPLYADGDMPSDDRVWPLRYVMSVSEGDRIVFNAKAGLRITSGGKSYLLLSEYEVLAKV